MRLQPIEDRATRRPCQRTAKVVRIRNRWSGSGLAVGHSQQELDQVDGGVRQRSPPISTWVHRQTNDLVTPTRRRTRCDNLPLVSQSSNSEVEPSDYAQTGGRPQASGTRAHAEKCALQEILLSIFKLVFEDSPNHEHGPCSLQLPHTFSRAV